MIDSVFLYSFTFASSGKVFLVVRAFSLAVPYQGEHIRAFESMKHEVRRDLCSLHASIAPNIYPLSSLNSKSVYLFQMQISGLKSEQHEQIMPQHLSQVFVPIF